MIALLSTLFRVVLVLFIVRLSVRVAVDLFRPRRAPDGGRTVKGAAVDLVRDRVCNTFLPRARAVRAVISGHEEHFCSAACAQRALAESAGPA